MLIIDTRIVLCFLVFALVQPFFWPLSINDIPSQIIPDENTKYVTKKEKYAVTNPPSSIPVVTTSSHHSQHKKSKIANYAHPKATVKKILHNSQQHP